MNGTTIALPGVGFDALDGVPSAVSLATASARQRYAHAVVLALLDAPGWIIDSWPWGECPPFLEARAADADWPVIYKAHQGVALTLLMRPPPRPDDFEGLIDAALARHEGPWVADARIALMALAHGDYPALSTAALDGPFSAAIFKAAQQGNAALQSAFNSAVQAGRQTA